MEILFFLLYFIVLFPVIIWMTKFFIFEHHIVLQIEADETTGTWNKINAFFSYINNPSKLKSLKLIDNQWVYK